MKIRLRGQFAKLNKIQRRLATLGEGRAFKTTLAKSLANEALSLVQESFITSRDPNGRRWPKLKSRVGQPLRDRGILMNSITQQSNHVGFRLGTKVVYAAAHNYGAVIKQAARTELRAYKETRGGKRSRIGLYSKAQRRVVKGVDIKARTIRIPRRQFIPDQGVLPRRWKKQFDAITDKLMAQHLEASIRGRR
jgi:phage gpG-like protein